MDNNNLPIYKNIEHFVDVDKILDFIENLEVNSLSADDKTRLYTALRKRFLGFDLPSTVNQSLSLGGVQIVGGSINLNLLDAKIILEAVEKMIEKDPEFIVKLAEIIAKNA